MGDIAIVGLDCTFPGAPGGSAYWDLLMRGGDAVSEVPQQRWDAKEFGSAARGGFIEDPDAFDNDFFAVTPREAAVMDPQQRLLLHCAWRALEDSGRAPGEFAGTGTGVFIGVMGSEWGQLHMSDYPRVSPQLGAGSSASMTANRISYHLGLTGPSLAVDTACSSSLVAVHLACNALLAGECDDALAGGVNLVLTPALGLVYSQLGLASPGGCKPFGADADGIVRADGVGLVALRRLEDAIADGQQIYAVIRGTAVNQDGRSNGVTAPNRWAQQSVIEAAYRRAGVTADQVRYVEAHGTGTTLGDMIECSALGSLHAVPRKQPCAIGSVKGNLGHPEAAAGIAGLIKVALALRHRIIPGSRFGSRENPQLRLAERGLSLLKSPLRLPPGEVLAGVSSFGMGGTNAHAVLATAPRNTARRGAAPAGAVGVFTVTADTPEALRRNLAAQAEAIGRRPRGDAAPLCWSSNRAKTGLPYRFTAVAADTAELAAALRAAADDERLKAGIADRPRSAPVLAFRGGADDSALPAKLSALGIEPAVRLAAGEEPGSPVDGYGPTQVIDLGPELATGRGLAELVAELYRAGLDPVWEALYAPQQRVTERLTPYVFSDEHRFWTRAEAPRAVPRERPVPPAAGQPSPKGGSSGREEDPVLTAVIAAVREVGEYDPARVVREARFYEDLGFDSVMLMQLKDVLETQLPQATEVSVQQLLPALHSVGSLAEFLSEWITVKAG